MPLSLTTVLRGRSCLPYFAVNNLNRDFVGTKGFSGWRSGIGEVERRFPFFKPYLSVALQSTCNAFYKSTVAKTGSRVDPHIDRSLRSYCKTIQPPAVVSVLYVQVPPSNGGELVLHCHKRQVGCIRPQFNTLLYFQGDLTHSVNEVTSPLSTRLSLVCEQYSLSETELQESRSLLESRTVKSRKVKK